MASILVIDDDPMIRELVQLHLRDAGHSIVVAQDAAHGIRAILSQTPDCIICDVHMPHFDGLELAKAIRGDAASAHVPLIMLTGKRNEEAWLEAAKLGISAYITKPLHIDELLEAINSALKESARPGKALG
jgi:DNA-binding response OmpR family regulator